MNKLRALVGLTFIGILVYSGLWHTTAFRMEKDTAAKLAAWRDAGFRVDHGKIKLSGFPYRIVITIDGLSLRTRGPGLDFGADSVSLYSHLWTPGHWVADATNVKLKAFDDALKLTDGMMRGSYRLHDGGQAVIVVDSLTTDDFILQAAPGMSAPTGLKNWQLFLRTNPDSGATSDGLYEKRFLDFKLVVDSGKTQLETMGGIMGPVVTDWTVDALAPWRDASGLLEVDSFNLSVPGGRMKGDASLSLDENFMPLGSATLSVAGGKAIADLFATLGIKGTGLEDMGSSAKTVSAMAQMGELTLEDAAIALKPVVKAK